MSNIVPFVAGLRLHTIPEDEVTIARLSSVLEAAFIDHEVDDHGRIYVTEGFPLWIDVIDDRELLTFFTYWEIKDSSDVDWVARTNELNSQITVLQFSFGRKRIWGAYWMTYADGLNVRQFVKMQRNFSDCFAAALSLTQEEKSHR